MHKYSTTIVLDLDVLVFLLPLAIVSDVRCMEFLRQRASEFRTDRDPKVASKLVGRFGFCSK